MKIYISCYRNHWYSPYSFLEKVFFWKEWAKKDDIMYPEKIHKMSERLTFISSGISWFLDKIHPRIEYVKIDRWDTWNMDKTLALIILPMLKQLKETKHGSQIVEDEDLPESMRLKNTEEFDEQYTFDFYNDPELCKQNIQCDVHDKWNWILDEIIWSFEQLNYDWEEQYWKVKPILDLKKYPEDEGKITFPVRWEQEGEIDMNGSKKHQERINNGMRLFGRYFQGLWD